MLPISVNPETSALVEISEPSCLAPTITALSLKSTHYSIPTRCFNFSWFFHPCPNAPKHWVSAMGLPGRDRQEEKVVSRYVEEFWWQSEEEILYHLPTPPPCSGERSLHSTFFSLSYFLTRNGSVIYLFIYLFCYKSPRPKTSSISSVFYFVIYDGLILSTSGCRCDTWCVLGLLIYSTCNHTGTR